MGDCCLQYHHLACPAPPSTWPTALVQGRGRSSYLPHDREDCTPPSNKKLATPRQHRLGNYPAASRANTYGVEDGALLTHRITIPNCKTSPSMARLPSLTNSPAPHVMTPTPSCKPLKFTSVERPITSIQRWAWMPPTLLGQ
ncbi:hypothetical protein CC2G_006027 [Coprinopsis cinerea AmutBmut pab1-1]|nr:hypothetical protein CC2G_006027 [Coprinopsis cinerea AmutBmut pab1-1]